MKQAVQALLIASALLLAIAPRFQHPQYNWVAHTISESAAQNTENGWIARTGLALYGVAVLALAFTGSSRSNWRYLPFGVAMILVAIWSNRPYLADRTFDATEDALHGFASALVGMSFMLAVTLSLLASRSRPLRAWVLDPVALVVSAAVLLIMANVEGIRGLVQRIMFFTSYVWFFVEVHRYMPPAAWPQ